MSTLNSVRIILLFFALSLMAGCSGVDTSRDGVRIGFFPNVTHAPALAGIADNRFQKAISDKTVEARAFKTGPELMIALAAGEIDAAFVGPVPAMTSASRGIPVTIISGVCSGGYSIVAAYKSGVRQIADLQGKVIAVPQYGNTQDVVCREVLQKAGLQIGTNDGVTIAQCDPPDSAVLLASNRVAAVLMPEPWASVLVNKKAGYRIDIPDRLAFFPSTVLVVNSKFARKHPQLVRKLRLESNRIIDDVYKYPDAAIDKVGKKIKEITGKSLPEEVLLEAVSYCRFSPRLDSEDLDTLARVCIERGYVPEDFDWRVAVDSKALVEGADKND